jgi:phosphoribosyl 1,2-cyclic phosphodiesterase
LFSQHLSRSIGNDKVKFSILASGSKANSTVVSSGSTSILVDCGLSAKETFIRLNSRGISEGNLSGIIISHEHDDHVKGVKALANYTGLPVYVSEATYLSSSVLRGISINQIRFFDPGIIFHVGEIEILPFSVSHDAADPVCFKLSNGEKSIGILSDLGVFSSNELSIVRGVDALLLEANHDLDKLWKTHYPWSVKERIAGDRGHLSNECASRFIFDFEGQMIKTPRFIIATHVSENSNTFDLARTALSSSWRGTRVPHFESALQAEATDLYVL